MSASGVGARRVPELTASKEEILRRPTRGVIASWGAIVAIGSLLVAGFLFSDRVGDVPVNLRPGPPLPALEGVDPVSGGRVAASDFAGRPLVINMWASWCTGCVIEAPDIRRFVVDHPEVGFLGVLVNDSPAAARAFVERFDWTHPSIDDPRGELAASLGMLGLPTTLFVRADGTIAGEALGEVTYEQLVDTVAELRQ
jgi:thiol-disulfide isomerase/thioredoxin